MLDRLARDRGHPGGAPPQPTDQTTWLPPTPRPFFRATHQQARAGRNRAPAEDGTQRRGNGATRRASRHQPHSRTAVAGSTGCGEPCEVITGTMDGRLHRPCCACQPSPFRSDSTRQHGGPAAEPTTPKAPEQTTVKVAPSGPRRMPSCRAAAVIARKTPETRPTRAGPATEIVGGARNHLENEADSVTGTPPVRRSHVEVGHAKKLGYHR